MEMEHHLAQVLVIQIYLPKLVVTYKIEEGLAVFSSWQVLFVSTGIVSVDDPFSDGSIDTASDPDNQSMLFRLIGTANEKISQMFRVAQIHGLDTAEGLLLFGKDHFYLISGFTILAKTREIKDMYYLPANMYEPILPPQCYGSGPSPAKPHTKTHSCWKFSYEDIREVHKRR